MTTSIWDEAIDGWLTHLRAGGQPATTVRLRHQHVRMLGRSLRERDPWDVTTGDLALWMTSHGWKPATIYAVRSSLRSFFSWLHSAGLSEQDPAAGLPAVRRRPPRPHPLADDVLADVLARADERQRLILHLAVRCGLRRGEVARVRYEDVHGSSGAWSLVVSGKGERSRVVPIPDDVALAVRGRGAGWTFPGADGGHLSPDWVGRMISRLLPDGWSIHSCRHRFATRAYAATRDAFAVQALLGHASPTTTLAYVKVPDDTLRAAMLSAA